MLYTWVGTNCKESLKAARIMSVTDRISELGSTSLKEIFPDTLVSMSLQNGAIEGGAKVRAVEGGMEGG